MKACSGVEALTSAWRRL